MIHMRIGRRPAFPRTGIESHPAEPDAGSLHLALVPLVVWAAFGLVNIGSYRAFALPAVIIFTLTAFWIVGLVRNRARLAAPRGSLAAVPVGILVVGSLLVFQPTYMTSSDAVALRLTVFVCSLSLGALWVIKGGRSAAISIALSAVVLAASAWYPIRGVPVPGNDVWFMHQQAADGLLNGQNMYRMTWAGSPRDQAIDEFTYLPMSAVLLAPGKWLAGDVRWMLAVYVLVSALLLLLVARQSAATRGLWFAPGCLLALSPGHAFQIEMSWTEPALLFLILSTIILTLHGKLWGAVFMFALALAAKQHVLLLLPLFGAWRAFGIRRAAVSTAVAVAVSLPWVVADHAAMLHDTVTFFLDYPPSDRSSTIYAFLTRNGVDLPLAAFSVPLLITIAFCAWRLRCRGASAAELCLAAALVLLVASLMNKQAFYNQWWLVGSLLLCAVAFGSASSPNRAPVTEGALVREGST